VAYAVRILDDALEQLAKVTLRDRRAIMARIGRLAADPYGPGTGALRRDLGGYRKLRVGDYRVVYEVRSDELVVIVVTVGHRRHVYEAAARMTARRRRT